MVAFDLSGNFRWTVPGNWGPKIATADGGVIAALYSAPYSTTTLANVTFDQNGRATGQLASLPVQSWMGDTYLYGSVDLIETPPLALATSFWAIPGGNASGNGTAKLPQFVRLSANSERLLTNALADLRINLGDQECSSAAQAWIFGHFQDANGNSLTTPHFQRYLATEPTFYDITLSNWPYRYALCGKGWANWFNLINDRAYCLLNAPGESVTVASKFRSTGDAAITETPSYPLNVFFDPGRVSAANEGRSPDNEARWFHEALHGITGKYDNQIQSTLGITVQFDSQNISDYIKERVLSVCPVGR